MAPINPGSKRRHSSGEATRTLLMNTAERLFARSGPEGVSLREIQVAAGQSNSSVITYHFGSRDGLVRAILADRYARIYQRRQELVTDAIEKGLAGDVHTAMWAIVRPLIESIDAGEMFVPFLARVSANPRTYADYQPELNNAVDVLRSLVPELIASYPDRAWRGRQIQMHGSVLTLLGEVARSEQALSKAQLNNYVDGWVGTLTAPMSAETRTLMDE